MSETNILAIVAIVMSAASLAWQAASWLLSGPVIRVLITLGSDGLIVTAYNSGRAPATITAVQVTASGQSVVVVESTPLEESNSIPFPLSAGGHASWRYGFTDETPYVANRPSRHRPYSRVSFRASITVGLDKQVSADVDGWVRTPRGSGRGRGVR